MSLASIILWLLVNLPDLIALIRRLFGGTAARVESVLAATMRKERVREELSGIIRHPGLTRRQKRLQARAVLLREDAALTALELASAENE